MFWSVFGLVEVEKEAYSDDPRNNFPYSASSMIKRQKTICVRSHVFCSVHFYYVSSCARALPTSAEPKRISPAGSKGREHRPVKDYDRSQVSSRTDPRDHPFDSCKLMPATSVRNASSTCSVTVTREQSRSLSFPFWRPPRPLS